MILHSCAGLKPWIQTNFDIGDYDDHDQWEKDDYDRDNDDNHDHDQWHNDIEPVIDPSPCQTEKFQHVFGAQIVSLVNFSLRNCGVSGDGDYRWEVKTWIKFELTRQGPRKGTWLELTHLRTSPRDGDWAQWWRLNDKDF